MTRSELAIHAAPRTGVRREAQVGPITGRLCPHQPHAHMGLRSDIKSAYMPERGNTGYSVQHGVILPRLGRRAFAARPGAGPHIHYFEARGEISSDHLRHHSASQATYRRG